MLQYTQCIEIIFKINKLVYAAKHLLQLDHFSNYLLLDLRTFRKLALC